MNEAQGKQLGHLIWAANELLASRKRQKNACANLTLSSKFINCELAEGEVISGTPDTVAVNGELLRVDCHLIDSAALRGFVFGVLRAAFDPILVGFGKALVVWDKALKSVIFLGEDFNCEMAHLTFSGETTETPNVRVEAPRGAQRPEGRSRTRCYAFLWSSTIRLCLFVEITCIFHELKYLW